MSRASRQFHRWERQTHQHAWADARQFSLDLCWGHPRPIDPYGIGLALESGEQLYRQLWVRYSTLGRTSDLSDAHGRVFPGRTYWRDWGWCQTLVTSHRLATRIPCDGGRLISVWWTAIAGVQIDLAHNAVVLDDGAGEWRGLYAGSAIPVIAVAAVERVQGPGALVDHPGLVALRSDVGCETAQSLLRRSCDFE